MEATKRDAINLVGKVVGLGLVVGLLLAWIGFVTWTVAGTVSSDVAAGALLGAIGSFASAVSFYYVTKYVDRNAKNINALASLEKLLNRNYNAIRDNIAELGKSARAIGGQKPRRYRFNLTQLEDPGQHIDDLTNIDLVNSVFATIVDIGRMNSSLILLREYVDEQFMLRYTAQMPDDAFAHNLGVAVDGMDRATKASRRLLDRCFDLLGEVRRDQEKSRSLFARLIKRRFDQSDRDRIEQLRRKLAAEMEESVARSRAEMEKYGMEPNED